MTTVLIAFLVALAAGVLWTRLSIPLAWRAGLIDEPDGLRKAHARPTPLTGGIAIFCAFATPLLLVLGFREWTQVSRVVLENHDRMLALLAGALLALALGLIDDKIELRPRWKLLGQAAIGLAAYAAGFQIHRISTPFGAALDLGVFAPVLTILWFVGCMNAVNLLDGLDGLAAGTCLFVSLSLFLVSLHFDNVLGMLLMASLSGATLGFLFFNFPPARIFLGDCGSMLLGYSVAALALIGSSRKAEAAVALFIPIVALGLPITDTAVVIFRRWYKHLPIATPDRRHIHHTLVAMGYSQRRAVLILYGASILLGGAALVITIGRSEVIFLMMGSLAIIAFVAMRVFSGVRFSDVVGRLAQEEQRRRTLSAARLAGETAATAIAAAGDWDALWSAVVAAARSIRLRRVSLRVETGPAAPPLERSWTDEDAAAAAGAPADEWVLRLNWTVPGGLPGAIAFGGAVDGQPYTERIGVLEGIRDALAARTAELAAAGPSAEPRLPLPVGHDTV